MVLGLLLSCWLVPAERQLGHLNLDVDTLVYALFMLLIGVQITVFAIAAKIFGARQGFLPPSSRRFERVLETLSVPNGLFFGAALLLVGRGLGVYAGSQWHAVGFGALTATRMLRFPLPSATAIMLGVEAIFASFFLGLLQIHHR